MRNQEQYSILLVDDDPTVIRVLNHILSEFSPVRFATSGRAALKLARESIPDLVILDVDMPEVSGFEVCKTFKDDPALGNVPIVFITGHESPQLQARGFELGAADFIIKPPHAPLVLARVRTFQRLKALSDTLSNTLRSAVTMDFLTGTLTRREIQKTLTQEWLRAQRSGASLALLLADIDGFTAYNAEFGEDKGDACLKAVADALRSAALRPTDVLGRYAGGKFALLLPETDRQGASTVAQRVIESVEQATSAGKSHRVTLSMGGAYRDSTRSFVPTGDVNFVPNDLIAAAEQALKNAKSAGGHQIRLLDMTTLGSAKAASSQI